MTSRKPLKKKPIRAPKAGTKRPHSKPKATARKPLRPKQRIERTYLTERLPVTQASLFDVAGTPSRPVSAPVVEQVEVVVAPTPVAQPDKPAKAVAVPAVFEAVPQASAPISGEDLYNRIQFNAYLLAEKDGFKADPVHYWIQAERAVKAEIRKSSRL